MAKDTADMADAAWITNLAVNPGLLKDAFDACFCNPKRYVFTFKNKHDSITFNAGYGEMPNFSGYINIIANKEDDDCWEYLDDCEELVDGLDSLRRVMRANGLETPSNPECETKRPWSWREIEKSPNFISFARNIVDAYHCRVCDCGENFCDDRVGKCAICVLTPTAGPPKKRKVGELVRVAELGPGGKGRSLAGLVNEAGYDAETGEEKSSKAPDCPVCYLPRAQQFGMSCSHVFCGACMNNMSDTLACPSCRTDAVWSHRLVFS